MSDTAVRSRGQKALPERQGARRRGRGKADAAPKARGKAASARRPAGKSARALRAQEKQRKLRQRRRQTRIVLALLALIVVLLALCGWQFAEYKGFQQMRAAVEIDTFGEGTFVEGVDVSQMTLEQALAHWEENIEPAYSGRTATLPDGTQITAAEAGYSSNYAQVLTAAYEASRVGGLENRYQTLSDMENGVDYVVTRSFSSPEALSAFAARVALGTDSLPVDAEVTGFDAESYTFEFGEPLTGQTLDRDALCADLAAVLEQGGGNVELKFTYTPGEVPTDDYGIISTYTTDASSSSSARIHNIKLAISTINGTCVQPGETFSFNGVVGERTKAAGYRQAPAYSRMETVMEYGGGICQVSSTLYAAVQQAGLEIVERHSHSLSVSYIPKGMDATVDWGNKDFKFANNRSEPIYIGGYVDGFNQVHIAIFGKLEEGDYALTNAG